MTAATREGLYPDGGGFNRSSQHLALEGIRPSIGSIGDAYDKSERIRTAIFHHGPTRPWPTSNTPPPAGSTR
jgi:hypothetical protein